MDVHAEHAVTRCVRFEQFGYTFQLCIASTDGYMVYIHVHVALRKTDLSNDKQRLCLQKEYVNK